MRSSSRTATKPVAKPTSTSGPIPHPKVRRTLKEDEPNRRNNNQVSRGPVERRGFSLPKELNREKNSHTYRGDRMRIVGRSCARPVRCSCDPLLWHCCSDACRCCEARDCPPGGWTASRCRTASGCSSIGGLSPTVVAGLQSSVACTLVSQHANVRRLLSI